MKSLPELESISACRSIESLTEALLSVATEHGFTSVLFGLKPDKATNYDNALISTNYPEAWREIYQRDRLHLVDPTVHHSLHHLKPFFWNRSTFEGPDQRALYEQAAGYGLKVGITLPMHGARGEFGLLSFASDYALTRADMLATVSALTLTRDLAYECGLSLIPSRAQTLRESPLTRRESECLKWMTSGKTSWEISRILACSEATVNFHVSNILKKFGVLNRQQAVAKSLTEGWILV